MGNADRPGDDDVHLPASPASAWLEEVRAALQRERESRPQRRPTRQAKLERKAFREDADTDAKRAHTEGVRLDNELRKDVARKVHILSCCALVGMLALVILSGLGLWAFKLSDTVLMAVITGTLAEVLALFAIVVNYLFPKSK